MGTVLEDKLQQIDDRIERLNGHRKNSIRDSVERAADFLYVVNIGGALIRRYQKPRAEKFGWSEKKLTIVNASLGIGVALAYSTANYFFGSHLGETFQKAFYGYPAFMLSTGLLRAGYSLFTDKAIGSPSIHNLIGTSIYAIEEMLTKRHKPAEGVEPSTY